MGSWEVHVHGVVHMAAVQFTSPQTSSQVSTTSPSSFHSVLSPPQGVQVTSLSGNTQGYSPRSDGVQASTLNLHHSDRSGDFSPPTGVQVSTVNLDPSQHNPMPGTNSYVPSTASGSIINTDTHAFQATLDLIVNSMASMQTQLNHVIDIQNVPINDDQHAKQGKSSQTDMTASVPGIYSFCDQHDIQHNMVQTYGQAPPRHAHFQFV